jgi:hypothetical protein
MQRDGSDMKAVDKEGQVTYRYPRYSTIIISVVFVPIIIFTFWVILFVESIVLKVVGILSITLGIAVWIKSLMKLNERIIITQDGITRSTPKDVVFIPWEKIRAVRRSTSIMERDHFKVISISGEYIVIGEPLEGYYELYNYIMSQAPFRESQ